MTSPVVFVITDYSETDTVDLANGNPQVISGSYKQVISENGETVTESFRTITTGATRTIIRAAIADLERLLEKAPAFHKYQSSADSIWLKAGTENETPRRTLLYAWSRQDLQEKVSNPLMDDSITLMSQWTIERHPYWEALPANAVTKTLTGLLSDGSVAYSELANANDYGTAPARIAKLEIGMWDLYNDSYDPANRIYIGYHPKQDPSNWLPSLYIGRQEYWTNTTYGSRFHVDATAITGYSVKMNFGTGAVWSNRFETSVPYYDQFSVNPNPLDEEAFVGKYLILFRGRMTNTNTVARIAMALQQNRGIYNDIPSDLYQELYIQEDDTDWHLYELGVVDIPLEGYRQQRRDIDIWLRHNQITLMGERLSGTGDMEGDSYIFIPYTHFISLDNAAVRTSPTTHDLADLYILQDEDDRLIPILEGSEWPGSIHRPEATVNDWHIPPYTQGTWVAAFDGIKLNKLGVTMDPITLTIFPRYYSYSDD